MEYFVYHFQLFMLIMTRMGSMVVIAPFFSSGVLPFKVKGLLVFLITIVIFPMIASRGYTMPAHMAGYSMLVIQEVVIGVYIGFLVTVVFAAFQLSGQFFSVQIGFGINEVLDPLGQVSIPLIGQLKNLIALLVFLAMDGHHFLIKAVYRSYELVPMIKLSMTGGMLKFMMHSFSGMFVVALKIALPVVGTILLITVSMGILAKAAPQMNIMMLGFPLKILVAFGVLMVITPLIVRIMHVTLERTFNFITKVLLYWPA